MADRSGAEILNVVFTELADLLQTCDAKQVCQTARNIAHRTNWVDCSGDQIDCDKALMALGLAWVDTKYDCDRVVYWYERKKEAPTEAQKEQRGAEG